MTEFRSDHLACVQDDGMPVNRVPIRMARDFHVSLSVSTVHDWVHSEAERDLGKAEYTQWVTARFSGVIGLDEAHEVDEHGRKKYLMVAVDLLNGRTLLFDLLDSRNHTAIEGFLQQLEAMGIRPEVAITDMWKAYHQAILAVFPDAKQRLCVFHVIQDVMKYVNKAILTYRRQLPQQAKQQKAVHKEIWEFRYPLKFSGKWTAKQRDRGKTSWPISKAPCWPKPIV